MRSSSRAVESARCSATVTGSAAGQRDGHGIGDLAFFPNFVEQAAKQAGAELRLRPFLGQSLRVHWLPEGRAGELPGDLLLAASRDPLGCARGLCRFFAETAESDLDEVARQLVDVQSRLAGLSDARPGGSCL